MRLFIALVITLTLVVPVQATQRQSKKAAQKPPKTQPAPKQPAPPAEEEIPSFSNSDTGSSYSVSKTTLHTLDQFPDQNVGMVTISNLEISSCDRFTHSSRASDYSLTLYEPSTGTTVRDRDQHATFGTLVKSTSLGDKVARLYKKYSKNRVRVTMFVQKSTLFYTTGSTYEGVVSNIQWLDGNGSVIDTAN